MCGEALSSERHAYSVFIQKDLMRTNNFGQNEINQKIIIRENVPYLSLCTIALQIIFLYIIGINGNNN